MRFAERLRAAGATLVRATLLARVAWRSRQAARARTADGRARARAALFDLLGEARGLVLKAGQVAGRAAGLDRSVPPRPLEQLLPTLAAGLGTDPGELFQGIEADGRAASLGQVHRARLRRSTETGTVRTVAVKIRYPDIRRAVEAELRIAGLVPGAGPMRTWGFDLEAYKRFLGDDLRTELDYRAEAERQEAFRDAVRVRGLVVPEVISHLCGDGVLVQAWEGGEPLDRVADWSRRDRLEVARILVETFLTGLFAAGRLHGDPNPGNLAVRRSGDPEVVLYDYGCVLHLDRDRRLALLSLILLLREGGVRRGRAADPVAHLAAAGFDPGKLISIDDRLEPLCRLVLEAFLLDRPFDPDSWRLSERMEALLGELKWWFRAAGPPDLLLVVRALHGLAGQLRTVSTPLPWWPLLVRSVGEETLEEARRYVPPPLPEAVAARRSAARRLESPARLLQVRVEEGSREVRSVSLPAIEALDLDRLVPEPVRRRLEDEGVDLVALGEDLWEEGLRPREVLAADSGELSYRVWLE
jgi:predicted unusual protein kinase regulating ubiquinone biosynthesis (AarF/ABC1/UbiB family)